MQLVSAFLGGDELPCGNARCLRLAVAGGGTYRSHRFTLVDLVVEGTLGCVCDLVWQRHKYKATLTDNKKAP